MRIKLSLPAVPVHDATAWLASPPDIFHSCDLFYFKAFPFQNILLLSPSLVLAAFCVKGIRLSGINNSRKQTYE